jgi:hypothetical protein
MPGPAKVTLAGNAKLGGFAAHDLAQERATGAALVCLVEGGKLTAAQADLLAYYSGELGVLGPLQAEHAAETYAGLAAQDRETFDGLLAQAGSELERAFLFKALSAHGDALDAIAAFAQLIRDQSELWLLHNLTLSAARAVIDGFQNGVKQQFNDTCVSTTAQALKGELDPLYALYLRRTNRDVSAADDVHPAAAGNDVLQAEQLHGGGGPANKPHPRKDPLDIGFSDNTDLIHNLRLPDQGFLFGEFVYTARDPDSFWPAAPDDPSQAEHMNHSLDGIAAQLRRGIPTPFALKRHAILALDVDGEGPAEKFLLHDPYEGVTGWLTREQIVTGSFLIAGASEFLGHHPAIEPGDAYYDHQAAERDALREKIEGLP